MVDGCSLNVIMVNLTNLFCSQSINFIVVWVENKSQSTKTISFYYSYFLIVILFLLHHLTLVFKSYETIKVYVIKENIIFSKFSVYLKFFFSKFSINKECLHF